MDLVNLKNGNLKTTSKVVAEYFGKKHFHVLRDIKDLECSKEFHESNFGFTSYNVSGPNGGVREESFCEMTRDGFMFLAMGFTGKEASLLKEKFIMVFNKMESALRGELCANLKLGSATDVLRSLDAAASIYGLTGNQKIISVNRATKEITQIDFQNLLGMNLLTNDAQEHQFTATDLGKRLSLSAIKFNKKLEELGFQVKSGSAWTPTEKGKSFAILLDTAKKHSNGTPVIQVKWKESVMKQL